MAALPPMEPSAFTPPTTKEHGVSVSSLNPYLTFNGTCEAAFKSYAKALGGTIEAMIPGSHPRARTSPAELAQKGSIMRAWTSADTS